MRNAERTIEATLDSIGRQTHGKLDIVVVDDGSTDGSVAIVDEKIRQDRRVRLVRQQSAGVAAARNTGAAATAAACRAFIDADDLWAPTKIEFQLAALARQGGPAVGLAYCWFASIDQRDRVVSLGPQPLVEGNAMKSLCAANWIGNGSSLLMRRTAFAKAGGYDPELRARGAQGAEDLLMCFRVAEHAGFAVVPRYLVGYRATPGTVEHIRCRCSVRPSWCSANTRREVPRACRRHRAASAGRPALVRLSCRRNRATGRCPHPADRGAAPPSAAVGLALLRPCLEHHPRPPAAASGKALPVSALHQSDMVRADRDTASRKASHNYLHLKTFSMRQSTGPCRRC